MTTNEHEKASKPRVQAQIRIPQTLKKFIQLEAVQHDSSQQKLVDEALQKMNRKCERHKKNDAKAPVFLSTSVRKDGVLIYNMKIDGDIAEKMEKFAAFHGVTKRAYIYTALSEFFLKRGYKPEASKEE